MQFVHLPSTVLMAASHEATQALPRFRRIERAHVAAALRQGMASGRVKPAHILRALRTPGDIGIAALGRRLYGEVRRAVAAPILPSGLVCPFDPLLDRPELRSATRTWLGNFLTRHIVTAAEVENAVAQGSRAITELLEAACERYESSVLQRVAGESLAWDAASKPLLWRARPACLVLTSPSHADRVNSVVMWPDQVSTPEQPENPYGHTATLLEGTLATPGLAALCDLLVNVPFKLLQVLWPRDLTGEGFYGGNMMFEDIRSYASDILQPDGTVVLTEGFRDHLGNEYGMDTDSPAMIESIRLLLTFEKNHPRPKARSATAVSRAIERLADLPGAASSAPALRGLAAFARAGFQVSKADIAVESLDDESSTFAAHVVLADFTGFEEGVVADMSDMNMQVGSDGALIVSASDPFTAYEVAVLEASRISILNHLLRLYVSTVQ